MANNQGTQDRYDDVAGVTTRVGSAGPDGGEALAQEWRTARVRAYTALVNRQGRFVITSR